MEPVLSEASSISLDELDSSYEDPANTTYYKNFNESLCQRLRALSGLSKTVGVGAVSASLLTGTPTYVMVGICFFAASWLGQTSASLISTCCGGSEEENVVDQHDTLRETTDDFSTPLAFTATESFDQAFPSDRTYGNLDPNDFALRTRG